MIFQFEDGDQVLGQASIIVLNKPYVKKHFFRSSEPLWFDRVIQTIDMMFLHHGDDLFHSLDTSDDRIITLHMHHIDHSLSVDKTYVENISNYLKLVDTFGFEKSKRDLQHYNLIYRKEDDEPFLIDWDSFTEFKNEETAYNYYKSQLCSYKWQELYNMNQDEAEEKFNILWKVL